MTDLDCPGSGEQYVSLSMSRDSDDDVLMNCREASEMIYNNAKADCSALPGPDTLMRSEHVKFTIPKLMSSNEVKDLSQALMGDHEANYISDEAQISLPSPRVLLTRLKKMKLRKQREFIVGERRYWPLLPLLVKAEINPLLTIIETVTTWIVFVSWFEAVFFANALPFAGGVALFIALTVLHFWYGFTRYHSFHRDWYNEMLTGKALDANFELTRDICSAQCHGDSQRRSQTGAILFTTPFTIFNHFTSFILHFGRKFIYSRRRGKIPESPGFALTGAVYFTNVLFALLWINGGPFIMGFIVMIFIMNQKLYSAMLFRRNFEEFLWSFLVGDFLYSESISDDTTKPSGEILHESLDQACKNTKITRNIEKDIEEGCPIQSDVDRIVKVKSRVSDGIFNDLQENSHPKGRVTPNMEYDMPPQMIKAGTRSITEGPSYGKSSLSDFQANQKNIQPKSVATNVMQSFATSLNDWTEDELDESSIDKQSTDSESADESSASDETSSRVLFDGVSYQESGIVSEITSYEQDDYEESSIDGGTTWEELTEEEEKSIKVTPIIDTDSVVDEMSVFEDTSEADSSTMNPEDVYVHNSDVYTLLESQPGTLAWKNVIQEATQKFACSTYVDAQHNWIIEQLGARDFFLGSIDYGWTKLNPLQIREKCKQAYEKQVQVNSEIKSILNGLKDLKRKQRNARPFILHEEEKEDTTPASKPLAATERNNVIVGPSYAQSEPTGKQNPLAFFSRLVRAKAQVNDSPMQEDSTPPSAETEAADKEVPKEVKSTVYFGQHDNWGYQHFVKVVRMAAEDHNSKEYTDDVHDWIIPRLNVRSFHVETSTGSFREATESEVRQHAETCYAEATKQIGNYPSEEFNSDVEKHYELDNSRAISAYDVNVVEKKQEATVALDSVEVSIAAEEETRDPALSATEARAAQEESRESPNEKLVSNRRSMPRFKKLFSRNKKSEPPAVKEIVPLKDEAKNDPELVKKWIGDQAKARRFKSKYFGSAWDRALRLRRKTIKANKTKKTVGEPDTLDDEFYLREVYISDENSEEVDECIFPVEVITTVNDSKGKSFDTFFKTLTVAERKNEKAKDEHESEESATTETDCNNQSVRSFLKGKGMAFYDQLMLVLEKDYLDWQTQQAQIVDERSVGGFSPDGFAQDGFAQDGFADDSTISSESPSMIAGPKPPPKSLLEYVEQKLVEELLCEDLCSGTSTFCTTQGGDCKYTGRPEQHPSEEISTISFSYGDSTVQTKPIVLTS